MTISIRYIVNDVDTAVEFYSQYLGFDVAMHPTDGFAALSRDGVRLYLNSPGIGAGGSAGGSPLPGGWNRIQIDVTDIDTAQAVLEASGVTIRGDVVEGRGGRHLIVEDPSGNLVELFEPARRQTESST